MAVDFASKNRHFSARTLVRPTEVSVFGKEVSVSGLSLLSISARKRLGPFTKSLLGSNCILIETPNPSLLIDGTRIEITVS